MPPPQDPLNIIELLKLAPLPDEGGYFKNVYTSAANAGERPTGTSIYYLVTLQSFSKWHKLDCDEIYHFYQGSPLLLWLLNDQGLRCVELGKELELQHTVRAGTWQASIPKSAEQCYSLVGTTCFPGYQSSGFRMPETPLINEWIDTHPKHKDVILKLSGA